MGLTGMSKVMFPIENKDLVYGCWEDDIIWDSQVCLKSCSPLRTRTWCMDVGRTMSYGTHRYA